MTVENTGFGHLLMKPRGEQIAQGSLAAITYLRENPDLAAKIVELVKATPVDPAKAKAARKAA